MIAKDIHIEELPELKNPLLIAGFDGWGNALDISNSMVAYLIRKLKANCFARINPDPFYRFDENRPLVNIEEGDLKSLTTPGGSFYAGRTGSGERDLVILKANEPNLRWFQFVNALFILCEKLHIETIITLGSMYDHVLHSDRIISAIASSKDLSAKLKGKNVFLINYQGPGAIHSLIHSESQKKGIHSISIWCHCPYYLQDVTHFGILSHLGALLSFLGEFRLDTEELDMRWKELNEKIQILIDNSPEIQEIINEIRKAKMRGAWPGVKKSVTKGEKVINLKDFIDPK